jgi:prephenate dehydrogenase
MLKQIAIIGVGLIGTSFALALKRKYPGATIRAIDRDEASIAQAQSRGAIDSACTYEAAGAADLVLLAIPVRQIGETLATLAPHLGAHSVVIDAGSTKQDVIAAARASLGAKAPQFVACHPIAGRERHGPMAADVTLFDGKNVVVTPVSETTPAALLVARGAWEAVGANVVEMPAATHDAVFAAVSHLPHMLAFALVEELASRPNAKLLFEHAASGFRDFTRIASSSPAMWRDIAINNRQALLGEMDAYTAKLTALRALIADADGEALFALMDRSQTAREHWLSGQLDQFNLLSSLSPDNRK